MYYNHGVDLKRSFLNHSAQVTFNLICTIPFTPFAILFNNFLVKYSKHKVWYQYDSCSFNSILLRVPTDTRNALERDLFFITTWPNGNGICTIIILLVFFALFRFIFFPFSYATPSIICKLPLNDHVMRFWDTPWSPMLTDPFIRSGIWN